MLSNVYTARNEMERRYAFVSEGAQNARWLQQLLRDKLCDCGGQALRAAGRALIAAGTWLQQRRPLGSAHA